MVDPLAEVVSLLHPTARFSKQVVGAGPWKARRSDAGQPFYCAVLEGACQLALDGNAAVELRAGDFALVPAAFDVAMSSLDAPPEGTAETPVAVGPGLHRIGRKEGPTDLRILAGHCSFGSPDATLLVSLLPRLIHVRGAQRLATFVQLLGEELREDRPAREVVLTRLLELLLIEALRSSDGTASAAGLVRGLADERLAVAIRAMHERPTRPWTVAELARTAAMSRSAFFTRFSRAVGLQPMAYLLAWRMALAKDLLRQQNMGIADVAQRVGYGSASSFSVAFSRHVGQAPTRYAREQAAAASARHADVLAPVP